LAGLPRLGFYSTSKAGLTSLWASFLGVATFLAVLEVSACLAVLGVSALFFSSFFILLVNFGSGSGRGYWPNLLLPTLGNAFSFYLTS